MKTGSKLSIVVFVVVAISHLLRLVGDVGVMVDDYVVPQWVSVLGIIIPGTLAWMLWKEGGG